MNDLERNHRLRKKGVIFDSFELSEIGGEEWPSFHCEGFTAQRALKFSKCLEAQEAALKELCLHWSRGIGGEIEIAFRNEHGQVQYETFDSRLKALDFRLQEKEENE